MSRELCHRGDLKTYLSFTSDNSNRRNIYENASRSSIHARLIPKHDRGPRENDTSQLSSSGLSNQRSGRNSCGAGKMDSLKWTNVAPQETMVLLGMNVLRIWAPVLGTMRGRPETTPTLMRRDSLIKALRYGKRSRSRILGGDARLGQADWSSFLNLVYVSGLLRRWNAPTMSVFPVVSDPAYISACASS